MQNSLKEEFDEFLKDKEEIREIIGRIGGNNNTQYKMITTLFSVIVLVILVTGIILDRVSPEITLIIITLLATFKLIWMIQQTHKSMHFQFWILNSLEIRINEIDKRQRKIEKIISEANKSETDDNIKSENKEEKE